MKEENKFWHILSGKETIFSRIWWRTWFIMVGVFAIIIVILTLLGVLK